MHSQHRHAPSEAGDRFTCAGKLSTYQQSPLRTSKKRDGEKRTSPLGIPYREKGQRKETGWASKRSQLAHARPRARDIVGGVVEKALVAFKGTRGRGRTSEKIWARIAWRVGPQAFERAIDEKLSEDHHDGQPRNPAATFQKFLNKQFPKPGGAR